MKLALDTNAYRALDEGHEELARAVAAADRVALPIIVLGELRFGFMLGSRLRENSARLDRLLAEPRVEVLDLDGETTQRFGEIAVSLRRAGRTIQQDDVWIAALCRRHGFVLATRDRGFHQVVGLGVLEL